MIQYALINLLNTQFAASVDKVYGMVAPKTAPDTYATIRSAGGDENRYHDERGTETGTLEDDFEVACYAADDGTRQGEINAAELAAAIKAVLRNFVGQVEDPASPVVRHIVAGIRIAGGSEFYDEASGTFENSFTINVTYQP